MAAFRRYVLSMTFLDGVGRDSVVSFYVNAADAKEYFAAASNVLALATPLGNLVNAVEAMTLMYMQQVSVSVEDLTDPVPPIDDDVLRGNKLAFSLRSGGRGLTTTLPGRDPTKYAQFGNELEVDLTTPAEMAAYVDAVQTYAVDAFGNEIAITGGKVVD